MGIVIVGGFVLFCIVGIACGIWKINMAINHPEKYERLKQFEKDYVEQQTEMARKVAEGAGKVIAFGLKVTKKK